MKIVTIDCAGVGSPDEFWQRYVDATQTGGEDDFGRNLDALWDAIEGGHGWPGEATLAFQNTDALSELRTAGGVSLLDGLRKVAHEATRIEVVLS